MKLTSIHLQNYRAHQDLRVEFNAGFNLVAGINGSGKTSLLKGISEGLTSTLNSVLGNNRSIFNESDYVHIKALKFEGRYRFEAKFPVIVEMMGNVFSQDFSISLEKQMKGLHPRIAGKIPLRALDSPDAAQDPNTLPLPLIAFYRANRQWIIERNQVQFMQAAMEKPSRQDGYLQWWDAAVNIIDLQHWVIGKCLERYQHSSETGKHFYEINDDELALVNSALNAAIDGIGDLRYDMQQKSLLVDWKKSGEQEKTISFDHLSDGQRAVICLVADIARRICLINPQLGMDVIRKTPGVVLIDELDVHLHPDWQRRIVNGLKTAFPEIQFIATSHSPQILGELNPEEIILLHDSETSQPSASYGLNSSQILEEIMDALPRNQDVEGKLTNLFNMIENGSLQDAVHLLKELREKLPQLPELGKAEALIHRKRMIGR